MIDLSQKLSPSDLSNKLARIWDLSAQKIDAIERSFPPGSKTPVLTQRGGYRPLGWTEWTRGFQYGSALLHFDATGEERFLELGRRRTVGEMTPYLTHTGVHDHGFNNISTYGALWRLMNEGRIPENPWERSYYELALKVSGAVQATRWTTTANGGGFIYSFNGPHSLFIDTIRTCRALALAHQLGYYLLGENDERISLLDRLIHHAKSTWKNLSWDGDLDIYDSGHGSAGRVAHEVIFNVNDGRRRCHSTQQGYSPYSTWTRGLAWAMLGFAELLEWIETRDDAEFEMDGGRDSARGYFLNPAVLTCQFYLNGTPTCGVPYWDTGAPGLMKMGDYLDRPAEPFNDHEPVDSSAAAIAAQGLLRLGRLLNGRPDWDDSGERFTQAGLAVLNTLLDEPYLSTNPKHEGLLLHSVYRHPYGWDYIPPERKIPCGEASMWGDYHLREAAVLVGRMARADAVEPYYTFFGPTNTLRAPP